MLVDLNRLAMNHVQVGIEALGETFGKLFFDGDWLVRITIDGALQFLQTVAEISPFTSALESLQNLRQLVRKALSV